MARRNDVTSRVRRRIALAVASMAAAAAMAFTLIHPAAGAHTGRDSTANWVPFPTYYGAIAVSHDGAIGKAWRHLDKAQARQSALSLCGVDTCKVVSVFTQCGAVAHDGSRFHGGVGHSRPVAEHNAMTRLGGGQVVTWACN